MRMGASDTLRFLLKRAEANYVAEYKFHPTRRWRFDFYLPDFLTAIEIEGGIYTQGRHTRPQGYTNDCEKYNAAQLLGFKVLRYPSSYIISQQEKVYGDIMRVMRGEDSGASASPILPDKSEPEEIRQGD